METNLAEIPHAIGPKNSPAVYTIRKRTVWIIAGAFFVLCLALTPLFVKLFRETAEAKKVLTSFGEALVSKDYHRAYDMGSPDFKEAKSESAFVDQQTALCSHLGALKKVTPGAYETEQKGSVLSSTIDVQFVFEKAERQFVFTMKKESNGWRVFGYKEQ